MQVLGKGFEVAHRLGVTILRHSNVMMLGTAVDARCVGVNALHKLHGQALAGLTTLRLMCTALVFFVHGDSSILTSDEASGDRGACTAVS
jgi:hypothetical protein